MFPHFALSNFNPNLQNFILCNNPLYKLSYLTNLLMKENTHTHTCTDVPRTHLNNIQLSVVDMNIEREETQAVYTSRSSSPHSLPQHQNKDLILITSFTENILKVLTNGEKNYDSSQETGSMSFTLLEF